MLSSTSEEIIKARELAMQGKRGTVRDEESAEPVDKRPRRASAALHSGAVLVLPEPIFGGDFMAPADAARSATPVLADPIADGDLIGFLEAEESPVSLLIQKDIFLSSIIVINHENDIIIEFPDCTKQAFRSAMEPTTPFRKGLQAADGETRRAKGVRGIIVPKANVQVFINHLCLEQSILDSKWRAVACQVVDKIHAAGELILTIPKAKNSPPNFYSSKVEILNHDHDVIKIKFDCSCAVFQSAVKSGSHFGKALITAGGQKTGEKGARSINIPKGNLQTFINALSSAKGPLALQWWEFSAQIVDKIREQSGLILSMPIEVEVAKSSEGLDMGVPPSTKKDIFSSELEVMNNADGTISLSFLDCCGVAFRNALDIHFRSPLGEALRTADGNKNDKKSHSVIISTAKMQTFIDGLTSAERSRRSPEWYDFACKLIAMPALNELSLTVPEKAAVGDFYLSEVILFETEDGNITLKFLVAPQLFRDTLRKKSHFQRALDAAEGQKGARDSQSVIIPRANIPLFTKAVSSGVLGPKWRMLIQKIHEAYTTMDAMIEGEPTGIAYALLFGGRESPAFNDSPTPC